MPYRRKILVIEDRADQWKLIRTAIENSMPNTEVVWAANIDHAVDYLQTQTDQQLPDLILLDLYLPKREDGWQFLKAIKQHELYRLLPVVVFSHSDSNEDVKGSYDLGCSSYLVKSVDMQEWVNCFALLHTYWWQTATLPFK